MFDTVKIDFPSGQVELVPSLDAVELISSAFGDFNNALTAVSSMNFNAIVNVIDAGIPKLKKAGGYSKSGLKENVFELGFVSIIPDVADFIIICANGGKRPSDEDDKNESKKKTQ